MTNYNLKPMLPPSLLAQQKKAERRKVLEAVRQRRKIISQRFSEKMQQQADKDMV